jgi:YtfJ family uncharacterized protein
VNTLRLLTLFITLLASHAALSGPPAVGSTLPPLNIEDRGELNFHNDDFSFSPWSSSSLREGVHVVQYFGANMGDSEKFKPFTNTLEQTFGPQVVAVTTVLNMDAALWGTGGFVLSEVKKSKKQYPGATIVIDEDGLGVQNWGLGKVGSALMIIDGEGTLRYINQNALNAAELKTALALLQKSLIGSL